jgi:hypothetical protein
MLSIAQSSRYLCFQEPPSRRWAIGTLPLIAVAPELRRLSRKLSLAMAAPPAFEVAVKGDPDAKVLGDCMSPVSKKRVPGGSVRAGRTGMQGASCVLNSWIYVSTV